MWVSSLLRKAVRIAFFSASYFCLLMFFPLFPRGCFVRIFSSVTCPLSLEYSFYESEFVLLTHKHAFAEAVVNLPAVGRLNCNLFNADFPQRLRNRRRPIQIDHANLRVFLPEVRPKLRSVPVNARRAVPRMPQGALPLAQMGTRKGQASAWHGRGSDFQRLWILHH